MNSGAFREGAEVWLRFRVPGSTVMEGMRSCKLVDRLRSVWRRSLLVRDEGNPGNGTSGPRQNLDFEGRRLASGGRAGSFAGLSTNALRAEEASDFALLFEAVRAKLSKARMIERDCS